MRPWELRSAFVVDFYDGLATLLCVDARGTEILRVRPFLSVHNVVEWISDKARFSFDSYSRQRLLAPNFSGLIHLKCMIYAPSTGWFFVLNHIYKRYWGGLLAFFSQKFLSGVLRGGVSSYSFFASFLDLEFLSVAKGYFKTLFAYSFYDLPFLVADFTSSYLMPELDHIGLAVFFSLNSRLEMPLFHLKVRQAILRRGLFLLSFASLLEANIKKYDLGFSFASFFSFFFGRSRYVKLFFKVVNSAFFVGKAVLLRFDSLVNLLREFNNYLSSFLSVFWGLVSADLALVNALDISLFTKNFGGDLCFSSSNDFLYSFGLSEVFFNTKKKIELRNFVLFSPFVSDTGFFGFNFQEKYKMFLPLCHPYEKKSSFLTSQGFFRVSDYVLTPKGDVRLDWMVLASFGYYITLFTSSLFSRFVKKVFLCLLEYFLSLSLGLFSLSLSFLDKIGFSLSSPLFDHFFFTDAFSRNSYAMGLCVARLKWFSFRYNF